MDVLVQEDQICQVTCIKMLHVYFNFYTMPNIIIEITGIYIYFLSFLQCGVISPRFDVKLKDIEKWASYLMPSRQFGWVNIYHLIKVIHQFTVLRKQSARNDHPFLGAYCWEENYLSFICNTIIFFLKSCTCRQFLKL